MSSTQGEDAEWQLHTACLSGGCACIRRWENRFVEQFFLCVSWDDIKLRSPGLTSGVITHWAVLQLLRTNHLQCLPSLSQFFSQPDLPTRNAKVLPSAFSDYSKPTFVSEDKHAIHMFVACGYKVFRSLKPWFTETQHHEAMFVIVHQCVKEKRNKLTQNIIFRVFSKCWPCSSTDLLEEQSHVSAGATFISSANSAFKKLHVKR